MMVTNLPPHKIYLIAFLLIIGGRTLTAQVNKTTDVDSVVVEEKYFHDGSIKERLKNYLFLDNANEVSDSYMVINSEFTEWNSKGIIVCEANPLLVKSYYNSGELKSVRDLVTERVYWRNGHIKQFRTPIGLNQYDTTGTLTQVDSIIQFGQYFYFKRSFNSYNKDSANASINGVWAGSQELIFEKDSLCTNSGECVSLEEWNEDIVKSPSFSFDELNKLSKQKFKGYKKVGGGALISKTFYCDSLPITSFHLKESKVTNKEYREFIESVSKDTFCIGKHDYECPETDWSYAEFLRDFLPDTSSGKQIQVETGFVDPCEYFKNKKYANYPVVGVSWFAARYYCNWLTNQWRLKNKDLGNLKQLVSFRLPTEAEWEYAFKKSEALIEKSSKPKQDRSMEMSEWVYDNYLHHLEDSNSITLQRNTEVINWYTQQANFLPINRVTALTGLFTVLNTENNRVKKAGSLRRFKVY